MRADSSAPRPESPPEHVRMAVPEPARRAHGEGLGELEQVVDVGRPCRARLLHEGAEDAVVPGHRSRVRGRRGRAGSRRPDLEHRDADPGVGAGGERVAQPCAVTVGFDEQRDRSHAFDAREVLHPVRRRDDRLVAGRDRRVQPQPTPGGERVDDEVAALRDQRDVTRLRCRQRVAPQRRPRVQRDQPVAVRPADRQREAVRRRAQLLLELDAHGALAEAGAVDHRAAASQPPRFLDDRRNRGRRDRDDDRVRRRREIGQRRKARQPVDGRAARVDAPDLAGEAEPLQVQQRLGGVGVRALGGADDGDRARVEQAVH